MIGIERSNSNDLAQATEDYVNNLLQGNSYLRQRTGYSQTTIDGRRAFTTVLSGRSAITGRNETVTVYTTQLRSGEMFYIATVAPEEESYRYNNAFRAVIDSVQLSDR
jgi:hypothetical protein